MPIWRRAISLLAFPLLLTACAPMTATKAPPESVASLRFIGEQRLPWRQQFQDTMVGGLSGIDYDGGQRRMAAYQR